MKKPAAPRNYDPKKRFINTIRNAFTNPYNLIVLVALVLLGYLIVVPLVQMVLGSFQVSSLDVPRLNQEEGSFTLYYWVKLLASRFSQTLLYAPLLNSLIIGISVSVLSIGTGAVLAWLMVRTDLPCKRFFSLAILIPYMLPSWCNALAWITIFKNERIGGSMGFLAFLGIQTPDWLAYGMLPIILALSVHYYAYSYLLVSAALGSVNSELEEMGEIVGANRFQILRKITLPLVLPAILSAFILTFSNAISAFGVPAFLGMKINLNTISTMLFTAVKQRQTNIGFGISIVLIIIASSTVYMNQKMIGARKSFTTIGGKGGRSTLLRLGRWRVPFAVLLVVFLMLAAVAPLIILILRTVMLKSGDYSLSNLTLHFWFGQGDPHIYENEPGIFRNPLFWQYVWNTMKLVVVTSIFATFFGQLFGYVITRGRAKFSGKLLEQLTFIPYLIPSIAFSAIYLSMFAQRHLFIPALYGTFTLLVLISVVKHLPFSSRAGTANMLQISTELEEAAKMQGAGFFRRMVRILLPLSKAGFFSGFLLIFISIMKELDLVVLLMTPEMTTLPYMAFSYANNNFEPYSNAVAVLIFLIVLIVYWIATKFSNADLSKGMGG